MRRWPKLAIVLIACCYTYAEDCAKASISLSVLDKNSVLTTLREDKISVKAAGKPAKVTHLSFDTNPRRIVLLVDRSGSMSASGQDHRWGLGLLISGFAADAVPINSAVILVTFGEKITQQSKDFQTRAEVQQRVLALKDAAPAGRTPLLDSIEDAISIFGVPQFGDAIYLVSDGGDNRSTVTLSKLQPQLIEHGIRVFAFSVRPPLFDEVGPNPNLLKDLAESTGGDFFSFPEYPSDRGQSEMSHLGLRIAQQVQQLYKVELEIPEPALRNRHLKIALTTKPNHRDLIQLAYPRMLKQCDLPQ